MCVCGGGGGGGISGPLYEDWVLVAHGLKSALKTVYVLVERMWVGACTPHSMLCI